MGVVAAVIGAGTAVYSASQARSNAGRVQNAANQGANQADPGAGLRPAFQDILMQKFPQLGSTDPNDILKDPSFQFLHDQGMRDINNKASSDGTLRSGTILEDMSKFNQDLSSTYMDKQFQRNMSMLGVLGNFSGLNTGQPGVAGQITAQGGVNTSNAMTQGMAQLGGAASYLRGFGINSTWNPQYSTWSGSPMYTGYDGSGGPAYG